LSDYTVCFLVPATYPCFIHTCTCCKMSQSLIQHWALWFNVTVLPFMLLIFIVLTHHFVSVMLITIYILLYNILIDVLLYFGIYDTFLQLMCYILTVGVLCLLVTIMQNCMYQCILSSLWCILGSQFSSFWLSITSSNSICRVKFLCLFKILLFFFVLWVCAWYFPLTSNKGPLFNTFMISITSFVGPNSWLVCNVF